MNNDELIEAIEAQRKAYEGPDHRVASFNAGLQTAIDIIKNQPTCNCEGL